MENVNLGTFTVEVQLQPNGLYDVVISHEGSTGKHYEDVTAENIAEYLMEDIENVAEPHL